MRGERASGDVRDGRGRHGGARISAAGGGARIKGTRALGPVHWDAAGRGGQTGAGGEFSHRMDRDRGAEAGRDAQEAGDSGGSAGERMGGVADAAAGVAGGGFFDGRLRGGAGFAGGSVGADSGGCDGAERRARVYAPAFGAFRGPGAGELSGNGALVSAGPRRSHRASGAARIFRDSAEAAGAAAHAADHRREPGFEDAEWRGGGKLGAVAGRSRSDHPSDRGGGLWGLGGAVAIRGLRVYRRHAASLCARRFGVVPLGHGHAERAGGGGKAVHFGAFAHGQRSSSATQRGSFRESGSGAAGAGRRDEGNPAGGGGDAAGGGSGPAGGDGASGAGLGQAGSGAACGGDFGILRVNH